MFDSLLARLFRGREGRTPCRDVVDLSSDYIDGELDEAVAVRLKGHLERCKPCRAFINTLRTTVDLLRATPRRPAPESFRERLRARLWKAGE